MYNGMYDLHLTNCDSGDSFENSYFGIYRCINEFL